MRGVEVFRAGRYPILDHKTRQRTYKTFTTSDLDQIVENFDRFSGTFRPAMVKGHVPGSVYDPAIPRHGTPSRVYRDGDTLKCDADDVDPVLAADIRAKRFADVSAEIYEDPSEAGLSGGRGMMLRRIAILGGDIPKVKGLNPGGLDRTLCFSESTVGMTVYCFSEGIMGRDEMVEKLLAAGMDQETLDTLDDVQLQAICGAFCSSEQPGSDDQPPPDMTVTPPAQDSNDPPPPTSAIPDERKPAMQFSEETLDAIAQRLLAPYRKRLDEFDQESKRARVHLFCENEMASGRIDPAEMDGTGGPTLAERLMLLDDTNRVFKFGEDEYTQLDAEMRAIRHRQPKFANSGRRVASGTKTTSPSGVASGKENDEARVMRFAEDHAADLAKVNGGTPAEFIETYRLAKPDMKKEILAGIAADGY
jgi:hypothetical protein